MLVITIMLGYVSCNCLVAVQYLFSKISYKRRNDYRKTCFLTQPETYKGFQIVCCSCCSLVLRKLEAVTILFSGVQILALFYF